MSGESHPSLLPCSPQSDTESSITTWVRDLNEQTFASDEDLEEEEKPSLPSPSDGEKATTATSAASSTSAASGFRTHDQGHCRPCVFHSSPGGCRRGSSCNYCHFFHPRVVLVHRIRKSTRDKIKCRLASLLGSGVDLDEIWDDLQLEGNRHPLAWVLIQGYLRDRLQKSQMAASPAVDPGLVIYRL